MLKQPGFAERVREQYVYIAETDHLLLQDLPNRATPLLNVAFFFPYMSPVPEAQARDTSRSVELGSTRRTARTLHATRLRDAGPLTTLPIYLPIYQARVVKRYFSDHLAVQPVGPSPAIMHVDSLKKLAPLWCDPSVANPHPRSSRDLVEN